jgi:hypothetical protein
MTVARVSVGECKLEIDDARWGADARDGIAFDRVTFGAARVVMRDDYSQAVHSLDTPGRAQDLVDWIDWEQTGAHRRWLASHGFGIAEAMDTAQRFMIGWPAAERLIDMCGRLDLPGGFVAGASADHLERIESEADLVEGVAYQCRVIDRAGGMPVILPMAELSARKASADEHVRIYRDIIARCEGPVLIHWLGPMFLPSLEGYFPGRSFEQLMESEPDRIAGAKLSMLDDALERRLRRSMLEQYQLMFTGDDFNFAGLIEGETTGTTRFMGRDVPIGDFSHALLGIFDAIAAPAGRALRELARGNLERYREIMQTCEALSRIIFEAPTQHYKAGLAFIAWLDGRQSNPMLVNRQDLARSREHLVRVAVAAAEAGVFEHAATAADRLNQWLAADGRSTGAS